MSTNRVPKILLIITAVLAVPVIALVAFMLGRGGVPVQTNTTNTTVTTNTPKNTNTTTNISPTTTVVTNTTTDEPESDVDVTLTEGVTWIEPEQLGDLQLVADDSVDITTYYRVATLSDGGSIVLMKQSSMGVTVSYFRSDDAGTYYLLSQHTGDTYLVENAATLLSDGVTVDTTTQYAELIGPETLSIDGLSLVKRNFAFYPDVFLSDVDTSTTDLTEVASGEVNVLYVAESPVETTYDNGLILSKKYLLKLADTTIETYGVDHAILADDGSLNVDIDSDAKDFADRQFSEGVVVNGCGVVGGNQFLADATPEAFDQIGVTKSGDPVYTVTDSESSVLRNAYESYKVGRDYEGSTVDLFTYEEFVAEQPVVLWADAAGDYLLFMDQAMAPAVECGKPLIYLYPTQPTQVSVQVGADVTKSEPTYGDGWNVLAQPSGTQLYWEGKGHGEYPAITFGRVVPRTQAELAIKSDLVKQGFTAQEIQDFMEFWQPRLPNTRYVRLSWLNTEQMNQLAPLYILPKPDTLIRTFLDFSGQNTTETNLVPQQFTAVSRGGFTVMEWGGLLLGQ